MNWKFINWTIAICFVGLNMLGIGMSHQRRQAEAASERSKIELRTHQAEQLAIWHNARTLPMGDSRCADAIRQFRPAEQLTPLPSGYELGWNDLTSAESSDLTKAIQGLMDTYRRDGALHVISYMRSRGETLCDAQVGQLRGYLANHHGLDDEALAKKSLKEQFVLYWDALDSTSAWKSLLPEQSEIRIWQCDSDAINFVDDVATLSDRDMNLWQFRSERYHNFTHETDTVASQVECHSGVKIADVRLIVEHRGKGVHTICPYVVRFWYSSERKKWIPHLLTIYATSNDIPTSLLF